MTSAPRMSTTLLALALLAAGCSGGGGPSVSNIYEAEKWNPVSGAHRPAVFVVVDNPPSGGFCEVELTYQGKPTGASDGDGINEGALTHTIDIWASALDGQPYDSAALECDSP